MIIRNGEMFYSLRTVFAEKKAAPWMIRLNLSSRLTIIPSRNAEQRWLRLPGRAVRPRVNFKEI